MTTNHARYACLILLAIGAGAALVAAAARVRVESANRTVALILDYDQLRQLSTVGGLTTREVLTRLQKAGATHVAITEQTLRTAMQAGEVASAPRARDEGAPYPPPTASFVGPSETIQRLHRSLVERLGQRAATFAPVAARTYRLDLRSGDPADILDIGIGYPLSAVQEINQAGLAFVPRPFAESNQWQKAADAALTLAKERNARLVIFAGTAAPGYPTDIARVADAFARQGLLFGYVEFGKQYGDMALASRLPHSLIRVHSINETEMLGTSVQRAADRFTLAVRERNIRACYVRLFEPCGPDPVAAAEGYVSKLATRLKSHGFELGAPEPYGRLEVSAILRWLAMLGVIGALGLCLLELLGCRPLWVIAIIAVAAVLALAGAFAALTPMAKLCALLGALALPTLAVGRKLGTGPNFGRTPCPKLGPVPSFRALLLFAASSGISLLAGLFIIGCLADTRFLVKLDQFSGVKISHLVPMLAVLLLQIGWGLGGHGAAEGEAPLTTLLRGWRVAGQAVVKYWHTALLLVGVAGLGLLLLRSGNESGVGVSGLELQFRAVLDRVFGVRPRTKELLIGHPLLVLAVARAMAGKRGGLWALLALGTVGQVSMVNTFSHLHTPVLISVARTLHGLWVGAVLGGLLYAVVELGERVWQAFRRRFVPDTDDAA
ncbi:MAG: hypothetical protein FJX75_00735 [Armatimonadetes bacterium]|nr:hypothetical protein [Armatimonadota bacterium]